VLYKSVNASPHVKDLEVLDLISRCPDLSQFVREVVYFEVYYHLDHPYHNRQFPRYNVHYMIAEPEIWPESTLFFEQTGLFEEDPTLQPEVHVETIARALSRMPNLRGVILKNNWRHPRDYPGSLPVIMIPYNPIYGPRSSRHYPILELQPHGISIMRNTSLHGLSRFDYGFGIMCRALSISNTLLQTFSVDYLYGKHSVTSGLFPATFSSVSSSELEHACNAFRSLRKISLSLDSDCPTLCGGKWHLKDSLAKMLAATDKLEELTVNFNCQYDHNSLLHDCLGTRTWPRLRPLCPLVPFGGLLPR
jgi:hypothetical protein